MNQSVLITIYHSQLFIFIDFHRLLSSIEINLRLLSIIGLLIGTEWSTIQGVIARVISKSDEREARGRFESTSTITPRLDIRRSLVSGLVSRTATGNRA